MVFANDGDGRLDAGEPMIPGVVITLEGDLNGDGLTDYTVQTTTDENGLFTCHAFPGDYNVTVVAGQGMPKRKNFTLSTASKPKTIDITVTPCQADQVIELWPNEIPGNITSENFETRSLRNHEVRYRRVCKPSLELYLPDNAQSPTGAVVICPGGGYGGLAYSHEGIWMAQAFNQLGLAAAVGVHGVGGDEEGRAFGGRLREVGAVDHDQSAAGHGADVASRQDCAPRPGQQSA